MSRLNRELREERLRQEEMKDSHDAALADIINKTRTEERRQAKAVHEDDVKAILQSHAEHIEKLRKIHAEAVAQVRAEAEKERETAVTLIQQRLDDAEVKYKEALTTIEEDRVKHLESVCNLYQLVFITSPTHLYLSFLELHMQQQPIKLIYVHECIPSTLQVSRILTDRKTETERAATVEREALLAKLEEVKEKSEVRVIFPIFTLL